MPIIIRMTVFYKLSLRISLLGMVARFKDTENVVRNWIKRFTGSCLKKRNHVYGYAAPIKKILARVIVDEQNNDKKGPNSTYLHAEAIDSL